MEFILVKREEKSPKEQLLELYAKEKESFICMVSKDWFKELEKCKEVHKDLYELNPSDYYAYFIDETASLASRTLMKIEVKFIEGSCIIIDDGKIKHPNTEPAKKIYYFE